MVRSRTGLGSEQTIFANKSKRDQHGGTCAVKACRRKVAPVSRSLPSLRWSLALVGAAAGLTAAATVMIWMSRVRSPRPSVAVVPVTADAR